MKICDGDGNELPTGQQGEVWMRTTRDTPTYRYVGAEAKTLDGGWESLGDIGWFDEDGYLYLGDRVQDMILSGGANIYPAEVEAAINEHPAVHSCAVIGLPDEDRGNDVHAIVEADESAVPASNCSSSSASDSPGTSCPVRSSTSTNRCVTTLGRCAAPSCAPPDSDHALPSSATEPIRSHRETSHERREHGRPGHRTTDPFADHRRRRTSSVARRRRRPDAHGRPGPRAHRCGADQPVRPRTAVRRRRHGGRHRRRARPSDRSSPHRSHRRCSPRWPAASASRWRSATRAGESSSPPGPRRKRRRCSAGRSACSGGRCTRSTGASTCRRSWRCPTGVTSERRRGVLRQPAHRARHGRHDAARGTHGVRPHRGCLQPRPDAQPALSRRLDRARQHRAP